MSGDEAVRRILMARIAGPDDTVTETAAMTAAALESGAAAAADQRTLVELTRAQSLALLGSVGFGRIVFTRSALPAIRPVNHALIDGQLVIRTHEAAALTAAAGASGVVVAYEADTIDPDTRLGWSVVVTGFARLVTDPALLARYETLLTPWISARMEHAVVIQPDQVDGFRLAASDESGD